jgi:hypothetical protein
MPNDLTPVRVLAPFAVPGDRVTVVKGKVMPVGSTGEVIDTGSRRFGSGVGRWAKVRWDHIMPGRGRVRKDETFIALDNLKRL